MRKFLYGFVLVAAGCAMAQDADPPSRVARLNLINGPVSFRPGSVEDWGAATLNYPLTTGDHLWADDGAYAERRQLERPKRALEPVLAGGFRL